MQKLKIRPAVISGICGANTPVATKERAFIYASISLRIEEEKREMAKVKRK